MSKKIINLGKVKAKTKEMRLNGKVIEHKYDDETEWKELVDLKKVGSSIETVSGYSELPINANENDVVIVEKEEYVRTDSETVIEPVKIKAPVEGNDYNNFVHAVFKDDFGFLLDKEELQASGAKTLEVEFNFDDEADTNIQINELSAEAASIHGGVNHPVGAVVISTDNYNTSYIKIRGLSVKDFTIMMMGLELPDDMFAVFLGDYANDISADNPTYNWAKFIQTTEPVNEHSIDMGGVYGTVIFDIDMDWVLDAPISSVSLRLTDATYENGIIDEDYYLDTYWRWDDYSAETQNAILTSSNLIINHIAYGKETTKTTDIYNPKGLFQNDNGEWVSLEEKMNTPRFVDTYTDLPKTSIENGIMAVATESSITVEPDTTTTSIKFGNTYKLISANNITLDDFNALINDISSEYLPTDNVEAWIPLEIIVSENEYEECWTTVIRQSLGETGAISLFALPAYLKKGENIDGYESKVYRYAAYIMEIPQGLSLGDLGLIPPIIGQDTPPTFIPEAGKWYWFDVIEVDNGASYAVDGVFHEGFLEDYPYNIELYGEIRWNKDAETLYYDVSSFDTRVFNFIDLGEIVTNVYPAGFYRYNNDEWNYIEEVSGGNFDNKAVLEVITEEDIGNIQENTEKRHEHGNKQYLDQINQQSIDRLNQVDANTNARHTHSNKSAIDRVTDSIFNDIATNKNYRHGHSNSSALNRITDSMVTDINSNTTARHTHGNKSILDKVNETILSDISANTGARHTHDSDNKTLLDKFSLDYYGHPLYNHIPITFYTEEKRITEDELISGYIRLENGVCKYTDSVISKPIDIGFAETTGEFWIYFRVGHDTALNIIDYVVWKNGVPPPLCARNDTFYIMMKFTVHYAEYSRGTEISGEWFVGTNLFEYSYRPIDIRLLSPYDNCNFAKIEDGQLNFAPIITEGSDYNNTEYYLNNGYKKVVGEDPHQLSMELKPNDECELRFKEYDDFIIVYWIVTPKGYRIGEYINSSNISFWGSFFENYKGNTLNDILIGELDTSNGTDFSNMFCGCVNLNTLPVLDTSNGTNFKNMFYYWFSPSNNLETINLTSTSKGTNFYQMFQNCSRLETVNGIDTSNGVDFLRMFSGCTALKSLPVIDVRKAEDCYHMFEQCYSLKTIEKIICDSTKTSILDDLFGYYNSQYNVELSIENITIEGTLKVDSYFCLRLCPKLTVDSLMSFINAFEDNTGEETQCTVALGDTNLAKLTPEQIAVATNKNILLA